jgi:hypothetical protein
MFKRQHWIISSHSFGPSEMNERERRAALSGALIIGAILVGGAIGIGGNGLVTATIDEPTEGKANQISYRCDGPLPLRRRFRSEGPQRRSGDKVSLKIECVVDGGMDAEEALGGSS